MEYQKTIAATDDLISNKTADRIKKNSKQFTTEYYKLT